MAVNFEKKAEYLETFKELRRKKYKERTDEYYAQVITDLHLAVYDDNVIEVPLIQEVMGFLERPFDGAGPEEKSTKTNYILNKVIKHLGGSRIKVWGFTLL